ncbi:MAG: hypothetical protein E3J35_00155 [Methanomassiliicoccales archaeon]|nr:MAG: hypothetical protein E3J35_00155 [Methanomassiliicoccales archaeon]
MPEKVAADLEIEVSAFNVKESIPLCLAHALKPYIVSKVLKRLVVRKGIVKATVVPREPYKSILERVGLE